MKANEFLKRFGWDNSKECLRILRLRETDFPFVCVCGDCTERDDLERLVESHELIVQCGGLEDARSHLESIRFNIATKTWFGQALLNWSMYADKLEKAIIDVESCHVD